MKKTLPLILSLLCLLSLAACKREADTIPPSNTVLTDNGAAENVSPFASDGSSTYDPNAAHGKKAMYGYAHGGDLFDRKQQMLMWGKYYFEFDQTWLRCYDQTCENAPVVACFDPLCTHVVDSCPAFYQSDTYVQYDASGMHSNDMPYPTFIFADTYDHAGTPVIYSVYRRSEYAHVGTQAVRQDPCYLIQRYDVASGERVTLLSDIQSLIHSVYTYGDYIYYTMSENYFADGTDMTENVSDFTLCMFPKAGGEPVLLSGDDTHALDILDINEEGVYYLVNGRELYHCSPTLEEPTHIVDTDLIKDEDGNNTRLAAVRDEQLFYFGNLTASDLEGFEHIYSGDCYRLPLDDLSAESVKIAENMICESAYIAFTENYLYYMPSVIEWVKDAPYPVNFSDGIVKAVDLFTGETVTACENTGISFFTGYVVEGDSITVCGQAYEKQGVELANSNYNHIRLYPDGTPYALWYNMMTRDNGFAL